MNEEPKRGPGRPRLEGSGRLIRYIRVNTKRNYKHQFEIPSMWFNYLDMNCEKYRFELDTTNKRIIISVPTLEEIDRELERRKPRREKGEGDIQER